jgi:hypothetical protein
VVEAGVEPLGAVGGGHLVGEHVLELVLERLGVLLGGEVALTLAPVPPRAGEAVEHLTGRALRAEDRVAFGVEERVAVLVVLRDPGLAEVLGDHDVGGHLAPTGRDLRVLHLEHDRTIGVGDPRIATGPLDALVRIASGRCEATGDPQASGHLITSSAHTPRGGADDSYLSSTTRCWGVRGSVHNI